MTCRYCPAPHVTTEPEPIGEVCLTHLEHPPPTQLDRIETTVASLTEEPEEDR